MSVPLRYMETGRRPPMRRGRRRRRLYRPPRRRPPLLPLLVAVALLGGGIAAAVLVISAQRRETAERKVVERFGRGWERRDYPAMYDQLDAASRRRVSRAAFPRRHRRGAPPP